MEIVTKRGNQLAKLLIPTYATLEILQTPRDYLSCLNQPLPYSFSGR